MVRAVAHKVRRVKASAVLCQIAAQRHRGDRCADALDKIGARRAQRDDKRGFVLRRDLELRLVARLAHVVIARHHAHQRVVRRIRRGVGKSLPGIDEVIRRHLFPVRPARSGAQRKAVGHAAVVVRLFGVLLGHAVRQRHLAAAVVALAHQVFIECVENAVCIRVGVHRGVERVDHVADTRVQDKFLVPLLLLPAAGEKAQQHQRTERQSCDPLYCFHHASHWQNAAKAAWFFVIRRYYSENRSPCKGEGHKSYSLLPNCSCFSAQVRRVCGMHAAAPHPPFSFPRKKTGGVTVQKKGV